MYTDMISIVLSFLAVAFSLVTFFDERKRKRSEATIHAFDELQDLVFSTENYSSLVSNAIDEYNSDQQNKAWQFATNYLSRIEHFCVGVQLKTYDINTLNKLAGGFMIEQYSYWIPVIDIKRTKDANQKMKHYDEFETVAKKLCKIRGEKWEH